jgi:hypothetical protein
LNRRDQDSLTILETLAPGEGVDIEILASAIKNTRTTRLRRFVARVIFGHPRERAYEATDILERRGILSHTINDDGFRLFHLTDDYVNES